MGCDIHASVEWRRREATERGGEWWIHIMDAGFMPRDYVMFSCLVDGHSRDAHDIGGVAPERGLPPAPSDISADVKAFQEDKKHPNPYAPNAVCFADHTLSWLTPEEYREAISRYEKVKTENSWPGRLDPEYHALAAYMEHMAKHGLVRLVFGFDN